MDSRPRIRFRLLARALLAALLEFPSVASVAARAASAVSAAPAPATTLPADVLPIKSMVVFEGSFQSLQKFLNGLHFSRRLIALADCRIGAGEGGFPTIQTTLSITRYVDLPPSAVPAPPPAPKA